MPREMEDDTSPAPSSAPSSIGNIKIPNDSLLIQYDSIDPTDVIDNPSHAFGDDFYESCVDEKLGVMFIGVLESYQKLAHANNTLTLSVLKNQLMEEKLKNSHVYGLLDKFYMDVPDVVSVDSTFLNENTIPLFLEKQKIHASIKAQLEALSATMTQVRTARQNRQLLIDPSDRADDEEEMDDDEEVAAAPKNAKGKGKKRKQGKKLVEQ